MRIYVIRSVGNGTSGTRIGCEFGRAPHGLHGFEWVGSASSKGLFWLAQPGMWPALHCSTQAGEGTFCVLD